MTTCQQSHTDDTAGLDFPTPAPHDVLREAIADALADTKWACSAEEIKPR